VGAELRHRPAERGQGLGRRLLAEADEFAAGLGVARLSLNVLAKNEAARAMYARCGFREFEVSMRRDL